MNKFHTSLVLLFLVCSNTIFAQEHLLGYYKGEVCFRHCLYYKLEIRKNGTYRLRSEGYRVHSRERGEWITYDGFINLAINGVKTSTYLIENNDLYDYDPTSKEKGEIAFRKKH